MVSHGGYSRPSCLSPLGPPLCLSWWLWGLVYLLPTEQALPCGLGWHAALPVGGAYTQKKKPSALQLLSPSSLEGVEGTEH